MMIRSFGRPSRSSRRAHRRRISSPSSRRGRRDSFPCMTREAFRAATTLVVAAFASGCHSVPNRSPTTDGTADTNTASVAASVAPEAGESHFANIRRLTNGGENAEAYFSRDGQWLTFQSTRDGRTCDQQYVMRIDGSGVRRISNGDGKTTCGYFFEGDRRLFFASTHAHGAACPRRPDPSQGYVWGLDKFDIYTVDRDGSTLRRLTSNDVYTAEGTLSPDGRTIVFTSLKDGDLDIYTMNVDGSDVRRLTTAPGLRWRPVLLSRWQAHRLPRVSPDRFHRASHVPRPAPPGDGASEQDGDLGDEHRRDGPTSGDEPRRCELRAVLHTRRPPHHFFVELQEARGAGTSTSISSIRMGPVSSR